MANLTRSGSFRLGAHQISWEVAMPPTSRRSVIASRKSDAPPNTVASSRLKKKASARMCQGHGHLTGISLSATLYFGAQPRGRSQDKRLRT